MRLLIILFLFSSCAHQTGKQILDFEKFTIEVPSDWTKFERQGIDSYVGGITNGIDTLKFDYGWYSYSFQSEDPDLNNYSLDTVNGKSAIIIRPIQPGKGIIGIYIEKAYRENRFNLIGHDIENEKVVIEIFKSIKFKDSDTSFNSNNFGENYEPYTSMMRNDKMFDQSCGSCHMKNDKYMTGPGLLQMTKSSFDQWMYDTLPLPDSTITPFCAGPTFHRKLGKECTQEELSILRAMFK